MLVGFVRFPFNYLQFDAKNDKNRLDIFLDSSFFTFSWDPHEDDSQRQIVEACADDVLRFVDLRQIY